MTRMRDLPGKCITGKREDNGEIYTIIYISKDVGDDTYFMFPGLHGNEIFETDFFNRVEIKENTDLVQIDVYMPEMYRLWLTERKKFLVHRYITGNFRSDVKTGDGSFTTYVDLNFELSAPNESAEMMTAMKKRHDEEYAAYTERQRIEREALEKKKEEEYRKRYEAESSEAEARRKREVAETEARKKREAVEAEERRKREVAERAKAEERRKIEEAEREARESREREAAFWASPEGQKVRAAQMLADIERQRALDQASIRLREQEELAKISRQIREEERESQNALIEQVKNL